MEKKTDFVQETRTLEREARKAMSTGQKVKYYAVQARTWVTIGAIVTAIGEENYTKAITQALSFFGF